MTVVNEYGWYEYGAIAVVKVVSGDDSLADDSVVVPLVPIIAVEVGIEVADIGPAVLLLAVGLVVAVNGP